MQTAYKLQIFRFKLLIQIIAHQHFRSKSDGIRMVRTKPPADLFQKFRKALFYYCRTNQIAGSPVVHLRQKTLQLSHAVFIIPDSGNQNSMKIIFLIIAVNFLL